MRSTARAVLYGLCKAQAMAVSELPPIEVASEPQPPPRPAGLYVEAGPPPVLSLFQQSQQPQN